MKEKIYTIPISDAFALDCICPFCTMQSQLESNLVESTVGASMMEPAIRIKTNQSGFCRHHFDLLKAQKKALPLALILQSHLKEREALFHEDILPKRKHLFGEREDYKAAAKGLIEKIDQQVNSCYICSRMDETMDKFILNAIYMWESEMDFKEKFNQTSSFCMTHFSMLLKQGIKALNNQNFKDFFQILFKKEEKMLINLYDDVSQFANSFDYRNSEPPSEKVRSAVNRAIELL